MMLDANVVAQQPEEEPLEVPEHTEIVKAFRAWINDGVDLNVISTALDNLTTWEVKGQFRSSVLDALESLAAHISATPHITDRVYGERTIPVGDEISPTGGVRPPTATNIIQLPKGSNQ